MAATNAFKSILDTSRELLNSTNRNSTSIKSKNASQKHQTPTLPLPTRIDAHLLALGLPTLLATQISDRFFSTAMKLYAITQRNLTIAVDGYPNLPEESWDSTEASIARMAHAMCQYYERRLAEMVDSAVGRARHLTHTSHSRKASSQKKVTSFNQEYTPLLEKYFEYNSYPSAPDRMVLARKSMMTPRQIEVWFQNHRNRARKEGKPIVRRSPDELSSRVPLEYLEDKMPFSLISCYDKTENGTRIPFAVDSDDDDNLMTALNHAPSPSSGSNPLDSYVSPHSFPTTYEESRNYDTFIPKTYKFSCPPIVWLRTPAPPSRKRKGAIDMDDFCDNFRGRLSLCGPAPKKLKRNDAGGPVASWFAHKQLIPAPAPHPALIRPLSQLGSGSHPTPFQALAATQIAHCHAFQSTAPINPLATLINTPPRKVARLPKRSPKYSSLVQHGTDSTISDAASPSPTLRTSSINSSISSRRLSSSSCSSTTSSTLTTPIMVPMELPETRAPPVISDYNCDSDSYEDLFGDSECEVNPPIQTHVSFSPGPRKLPFNYDFASSLYSQTPSP